MSPAQSNLSASATSPHCRDRGWTGQAADVGENPPVGAALVPDAAFGGEGGVPRDAIHRIVIHRADDAARPRLNFVPFKKMRKGRRIIMFRQPNEKILVFLPSELLGNTHRATPTHRNRQTTAVLHALQS